MVGLLTEPPTQNRRLAALGLDAIPSTTGDVLAATARETWVRNPLPSIGRAFEREKFVTHDDFLLLSTGERQPLQTRTLEPDEANNRYGIKGHLAFDRPVPEPVARDLWHLKRDELERQDVLRRAKGGAGQAIARFAVGLGVSALDPLNVGLAFVPVVSQARYATWVARAGGAGGRAGVRAGVGAAEGAAGAAIIEPVIAGIAASEQADYDAVDSMLNIGFGTALGAGAHVLGGTAADLVRARSTRPPQTIEQAVEQAPVVVKEELLRQGVADLAQHGQVRNVQQVADATLGPRPVRAVEPEEAPAAPRIESDQPTELPGVRPDTGELRTGATAPVRRLLDYVYGTNLPLNPETVGAAVGLTREAATQQMQAMVGMGKLRQRADGQFRRAPTDNRPIDALELIARRGGLRDTEGHDLGGLDLPKMTPSGPVLRRGGMTVDEAGEMLHEAGYFGIPEVTQRPGEAEVLDLLDRARRGERPWSAFDVDDVLEAAEIRAMEAQIDEANARGAVEREDIADDIPFDDDFAPTQMAAAEANQRVPQDAIDADALETLAAEEAILRANAEADGDTELLAALDEINAFTDEVDALARGAEAIGLCRRVES